MDAECDVFGHTGTPTVTQDYTIVVGAKNFAHLIPKLVKIANRSWGCKAHARPALAACGTHSYEARAASAAIER